MEQESSVIQCSHCGAKYKVATATLSSQLKHAKCSKCKQTFKIDALPQENEASATPENFQPSPHAPATSHEFENRECPRFPLKAKAVLHQKKGVARSGYLVELIVGQFV